MRAKIALNRQFYVLLVMENVMENCHNLFLLITVIDDEINAFRSARRRASRCLPVVEATATSSSLVCIFYPFASRELMPSGELSDLEIIWGDAFTIKRECQLLGSPPKGHERPDLSVASRYGLRSAIGCCLSIFVSDLSC